MRDPLRLGALCWLMSAEFFVAQFVAQLASPGHNLFLYDISLLGVSTCGVFLVPSSGNTDIICSPLHMVFNAGIVLHGTLIILGVWLTRNLWPAGTAVSTALLLLALGGIGAMTVGAFPLDDWLAVHSLGAVMAIGAPALGLLILACVFWSSAPAFARWTGLVAVVALLSGLGHSLGGLPFGRGTMERLAVWPQTLWFISTGALFFAASFPLRTRVPLKTADLLRGRTGRPAGLTLP